jgi:hypothetical protein
MTNGTHTQYVTVKMCHCYGTKRYTLTQKIRQKGTHIIKTTDNVAVPADRNVTQKEAEKLKYRRLSTEIQRMWYMKCFIIPETAGATGIVTHILKKNLEPIP